MVARLVAAVRAIAAGVLALLFGCDGAFAPKAACYPTTCANLHRNCGPIADDGCGQPLDCGECPSGQTCGQLLPNVCDDTPIGWMGGGAATGGGAANGGGFAVGGGAGGTGVSGGGSGGAGPGGGMGGAGGSSQVPVLNLAGVYSDHLDLAWSHAGAPNTDYRLLRSINGGGIQPLLLDSETHYSDFQVTAGESMTYQVQTIDPVSGPGPPSNAVLALVPQAVSAWRTEGGGIDHSSANLVEHARPPGTLAWERTFDGGTVSGVAVDPPNTYFSVVDASGGALFALTADGGTAWAQAFPGATRLSHPSAFDGKVFVDVATPSVSKVFALDSTGAALWSTPVPPFVTGAPAPVSTGDRLVVWSAGSLTISELDQSNGSTVISMPYADSEPWSPTLSSGQLLALTAGQIVSFDLANLAAGAGFPIGAPAPVNDPWVTSSGGLFAGVAGAALLGGATNHPLWMTISPEPFVAPPALAFSLVYAASSDAVEVREMMTGGLQASLPTDGGLSFPPAFAGGVIYASSPTTVFAFDTNSHQLLWTTTPGGRLSIAQGMLYVAGGSTVRAYALTP